MACYSPLPGFVGPVNENGKSPTIWRAPYGTEKRPTPCGKCVGCRLTYSKQMALRCMHESQMHADSCFVTLTFDDEHLPVDSDLDVRHVQLFMKRLRKKYGIGIRHFFAGEYGGKFGRPHYHGLLFGVDFMDKKLVTERMGNRIYESTSLSQLWPFGFHSIGDVTMASAAYVARYCMKKVGVDYDYHRQIIDGRSVKYQTNKKSGECRVAEFTLMSRRPGIGFSWFEKYFSDVYPDDFVVMNGVKNRPPKYYDYLLDKKDSDLLESLKSIRSDRVDWYESTMERLLVKEQVKLAEIKSLKRTLEV